MKSAIEYSSKDQPLPTAASIANDSVQDGHKLRDDMVHFVESCKDGNNIRTWVRVFFAQDACQDNGQSLCMGLVRAFELGGLNHAHLMHKRPPELPLPPPHEWHEQRNAGFGSDRTLVTCNFSCTHPKHTWRLIVSSGLNSSKIA